MIVTVIVGVKVPDHCRNGGTCVDLVESYRCDCKTARSGNNSKTGENKTLITKDFSE